MDAKVVCAVVLFGVLTTAITLKWFEAFRLNDGINSNHANNERIFVDSISQFSWKTEKRAAVSGRDGGI